MQESFHLSNPHFCLNDCVIPQQNKNYRLTKNWLIRHGFAASQTGFLNDPVWMIPNSNIYQCALIKKKTNVNLQGLFDDVACNTYCQIIKDVNCE
jgi:hypothetical protein